MTCLNLQYAQSFSFGPENLPQKIAQESDFSLTGYWHLRFQEYPQSQILGSWYLGLLKGRAIFSDNQTLSIKGILKTAERYIPRLRSYKAKQLTKTLQRRLIPEAHDQPMDMLPTLLKHYYRLDLVQPKEIERALRLKILQDLDDVLFDYSGTVDFLPSPDLSTQSPTIGFDLKELLTEARKRRIIWSKVRALIPSLDSKLTINQEALRHANLMPHQEQHLRALISHGENLDVISFTLGQDTLDIARGIAKLIDRGLITVEAATKQGEPEILIIDDSPLILEQFQRLVSSWGYKVRSHSDPTSALDVMVQSNPIAIFLDINMPEISGFDLLKQIRRQPVLATVPLIMLTADRTLSNNWRAQWSGCKFLSKPLSREEIPRFKQELRLLIENVVLPGN